VRAYFYSVQFSSISKSAYSAKEPIYSPFPSADSLRPCLTAAKASGFSKSQRSDSGIKIIFSD